MLRLPRPDSTIFRLTLAVALLAWTALAFGVPRVRADRAPAPQSQVESSNGDCHDAMVASAGSHDMSTPGAPAEHGDCCRTACQCLAASMVVLTVPWVFVAFVPPDGHGSAGPKALVARVPAAPPLRPPIG